MKPNFASFIPAVIWFIISFILLILPGSDIPKSPIFTLVYFDKWVHIGMFGLLTILWCYPFLIQNRGSKKLFGTIAIFIVLYGISMEFVQRYFAVDRSFDIFDMIADSTGCLLAWIFLNFLLNKRNAEKK